MIKMLSTTSSPRVESRIISATRGYEAERAITDSDRTDWQRRCCVVNQFGKVKRVGRRSSPRTRAPAAPEARVGDEGPALTAGSGGSGRNSSGGNRYEQAEAACPQAVARHKQVAAACPQTTA